MKKRPKINRVEETTLSLIIEYIKFANRTSPKNLIEGGRDLLNRQINNQIKPNEGIINERPFNRILLRLLIHL
jgi:hypothetical protein